MGLKRSRKSGKERRGEEEGCRDKKEERRESGRRRKGVLPRVCRTYVMSVSPTEHFRIIEQFLEKLIIYIPHSITCMLFDFENLSSIKEVFQDQDFF